MLAEKAGVLQVGMADPLDIFAYDELCRTLKQTIDIAIVRESELLTPGYGLPPNPEIESSQSNSRAKLRMGSSICRGCSQG